VRVVKVTRTRLKKKIVLTEGEKIDLSLIQSPLVILKLLMLVALGVEAAGEVGGEVAGEVGVVEEAEQQGDAVALGLQPRDLGRVALAGDDVAPLGQMMEI